MQAHQVAVREGDRRYDAAQYYDWTGWYERNIPIADDLYDQHLREEGLE